MPLLQKRLGATDGEITLPDGSAHYTFGFADLTGLPENEVYSRRGQAMLVAPLLQTSVGSRLELTLTNLGLPQRPDLDDSHTIHWHGFPNQIPLWDGVPEASLSVPVGRDFVYYYEPLHPGTYMYHCHFEPVEHIQMGMVGPLIVHPPDYNPADRATWTAYGSGTGTAYDREYFLLLTELDPVAHADVHNVQQFDWTEYRPAYWLINGRSYPDTLRTSADGDLAAQPHPSLIQANAGERVLLRFINLGFQEHAVTVVGLSLRMVAADARLLRGMHGEELSRPQEVLYFAPGQTADVLLEPAQPGLYPLVERGYHKNCNKGVAPGGIMTHVQVHPAGTLPPQAKPGW
ncbi:MAG: multicopper oxidase domain-containing protein [Betaproteobacteria bacterium]